MSFGKLQQRKDLTAIAAAHHIPYVAQSAAGPHWQDLSRKAALAAKADGPAFLNVLADCPLGWGHERKALPVARRRRGRELRVAAIRGRRRTLAADLPAGAACCRWPTGCSAQKRFAHLFRPEAGGLLEEIQQRVDDDWAALVERCEE